MGAYECFMITEFGGARLRDQNFTGRKWQNVDEFEPLYHQLPILMKNGLWFLSTLSTVFLLVMFVYLNLKTIFLVLASFVLLSFFFSLSLAIYF